MKSRPCRSLRRDLAAYRDGELPFARHAFRVAQRRQLFEMRDPACAELRQAMLDWYVPRQGPEFESWLDALDAVAARIEPEKMFTFAMKD